MFNDINVVVPLISRVCNKYFSRTCVIKFLQILLFAMPWVNKGRISLTYFLYQRYCKKVKRCHELIESDYMIGFSAYHCQIMFTISNTYRHY